MTRLVSGSNLELSKNCVMRMTCPCYRQWHLLCRSCVSIERRAIKVLTARKNQPHGTSGLRGLQRLAQCRADDPNSGRDVGRPDLFNYKEIFLSPGVAVAPT